MAAQPIWSVIRDNLRSGTAIRNWTAAKGNYGDDFVVKEVTDSYVIVATPGAENLQRISRVDFETVYRVWERYCAGSVQRQQLRDATRFSKYVISILHYLSSEAQFGK